MELLSYLTRSALYATVLLAIYLLVWRNKTHHLHSRFYLLAALVLSAVLPLVHVSVAHTSPVAVYTAVLPAFTIATGNHAPASAVRWSWQDVFVIAYLSVCVLLAAGYLVMYLRILRRIRSGTKQVCGNNRLVLHTGIGPGTLGRQMFFPGTDADPAIIRHEQAHIQAGHRYDAVLIQLAHIFFWLSPAHWLLCRELKMVHEFEADRVAVADADEADYMSLLLMQHMGLSLQTDITHSFFHQPLKRRVMMLQKSKTGTSLKPALSALVLTSVFATSVLFAQSHQAGQTAKAATRAAQPASAWKSIPRAGEVTLWGDGNIVFKTVEKMPEFKGDIWQWIGQNVQYPEAARAQKLSGGAVILFTVAADGSVINASVSQSSGHQVLDEEALRVVRNMPAWNPGLQHGQPVPVSCKLPVTFDNDGKVRGGC